VEKVRYMISDAAAMAGVETHVLRYWEEELDLTIPRNEMGHRYYTRENILEFQKIKELKEQGYQLKAIRMIIHSQDVEKAQALVDEHTEKALHALDAFDADSTFLHEFAEKLATRSK
jgi:DNA-binding transcriptional MerR regulator